MAYESRVAEAQPVALPKAADANTGKAGAPGAPDAALAKSAYLEALHRIERLHRRFLDIVKSELDALAINDIGNVQAMLLYNIGRSEMTVGELMSRGYYQGANVSYNLKKLVEAGYLEQERSPYDRRSVRVRLSAKALDLVGRMDGLFQRHVAKLGDGPMDRQRLSELNRSLLVLERFWSDHLRASVRGD